MDRRTLLKSGASALALSPIAIGLQTVPARAGPLTISLAVLSFANSAIGMFGSHRSAKAAAKSEAAKIKMLQGLTESMGEVMRAQALMLKKIDELPNVIRGILVDMQKDQDRLTILSAHEDFLLDRKAMHANEGGRGDDSDAVARYTDRCVDLLYRTRATHGRVRSTPGANYDPASIILSALCLRMEIDLATELIGLGVGEVFTVDRLKRQAAWFEPALNEGDTRSVVSLSKALTEEIEQRQSAMLDGAGEIDETKTFLVPQPDISYSQDPYPNIENFACDGEVCVTFHKNERKTARSARVTVVTREVMTAHFVAYDAIVTTNTERDLNAAGIGLAHPHHNIRFSYQHPIPHGEVSDFSAEAILSEREDLFDKGMRLSEANQTITVAHMAIDLANRALRMI